MTEVASSFEYIETTIAPGVTIPDYRWSRAPRGRRRRLRIKRSLSRRSGR